MDNLDVIHPFPQLSDERIAAFPVSVFRLNRAETEQPAYQGIPGMWFPCRLGLQSGEHKGIRKRRGCGAKL